MGRFRGPNAPRVRTDNDEGWLGLINARMRSGSVVPIISNRFNNELVFKNHEALWKDWCDYINPENDAEPETQSFRFPDNVHDPATLTQYWSIYNNFDALEDHRRVKEVYLEFLLEAARLYASEERVAELDDTVNWRNLPFSEIAFRLGYAPLTSRRIDALSLLASLRFPVYVTTSYHSFLEMAIEKELGKKPRQEVCKWYSSRGQLSGGSGQDALLRSEFDDSQYEPSPEDPIVIHLFGLDTIPSSLVLTEDDYLDYLVSVASDRRVIHSNLRGRLRDSSILLLGYSLHDWEFKVFFRILTSMIRHKTKGFYVQLKESERELKYLEYYLKAATFDPIWMDTTDFLDELWRTNRGE